MKIKFSKKNIVLYILILSTILNFLLFNNYISNKKYLNAFVKNELGLNTVYLDQATNLLKIKRLDYENLSQNYYHCFEISIYLNNIINSYSKVSKTMISNDEARLYFDKIKTILDIYAREIKGVGVTTQTGDGYVSKEDFEQLTKELMEFSEVLKVHNEDYKSNRINKVDYTKLNKEVIAYIKTSKVLSNNSIFKHLL
ncbi:hypothetical protein LGK97_06640 [Clostridium sp. CS001]|uniref:hypothetical protein n=1 Tax=Clostridium sp. CS001 TaxID=2880648 RepID=UPI001CF1BA57|nr:hypothetical protein [Clostridium sp. CS001]MCB2289443.1 hypothetical protein [Clostridium sp. CS001]